MVGAGRELQPEHLDHRAVGLPPDVKGQRRRIALVDVAKALVQIEFNRIDEVELEDLPDLGDTDDTDDIDATDATDKNDENEGEDA